MVEPAWAVPDSAANGSKNDIVIRLLRMSEPHRGWRRIGALMPWISLSDCRECISIESFPGLFRGRKDLLGRDVRLRTSAGHDRWWLAWPQFGVIVGVDLEDSCDPVQDRAMICVGDTPWTR